jgi:hypothetical protein
MGWRLTDRLKGKRASSLRQFALIFAAPDNRSLGRLHFVRTVFHVAGREKLLLSKRSL